MKPGDLISYWHPIKGGEYAGYFIRQDAKTTVIRPGGDPNARRKCIYIPNHCIIPPRTKKTKPVTQKVTQTITK